MQSCGWKQRPERNIIYVHYIFQLRNNNPPGFNKVVTTTITKPNIPHRTCLMLTHSLYALVLRVLFTLIIVLWCNSAPHIVYLLCNTINFFVYWLVLVIWLACILYISFHFTLFNFACQANMKSYDISNAYLVYSFDSHLMCWGSF